MKTIYLKVFFFAVIVLLVLFQLAPVWGLFAGILFSLTLGSPFPSKQLSKFHKPLLQYAVVGLGFGMNIQDVLSTGIEGIAITFLTIILVIALGLFATRWFKVGEKIGLLISAGTAICGGSAIAAISPVIQAKEKDISIALGVVFVLNAVALLIFPFLGRFFEFSEVQFAWWSAIAIHDTSSVVGTASAFGEKSLALATTIKLTRAIWIIPLALVVSYVFAPKEKKKASFPYFILGFVVASLIGTYISQVQLVAPHIVKAAKLAFMVVLFMIGISINKKALQEMGFRPALYGIFLWLVIIVASFVGVWYQF